MNSYSTGLKDMQNASFVKSRKYQEQQWRAKIEGVHPDILLFRLLLIRRFKKLKVPLFASEMMRDGKRQDELFIKGVTNARRGQSAHGVGCAVDIIHGIHGWDISRQSWDIIAHAGKEIITQTGFKIVWGGDFMTLYDPAHWVLEDWRETSHAQAS